MGSWAAREAGIEAIQDIGYGCLFWAISGLYLIINLKSLNSIS
jgi:hypothetical protein